LYWRKKKEINAKYFVLYFTQEEVVDKFCYLGDMLSVDGDADAAVEARIQIDGINSGSWYHCLPIGIYH